jgi:hypothetical protein
MNRRDLLKLIGATPLLSATGLAAEPSDPLTTNADQDAYRLVIYGATPGGVACAVRAAREGLKVLLVSAHVHLGGMFSSGLGIMDTLYNGSRAPIYDEFRQSIYDWYRLKYGTDSVQYQNAGPGISKTKYEAHVAEQLINSLLSAEPNINILKGYYPTAAEKNGRKIGSVVFKAMDGPATKTIRGNLFADCSYEADLAVIAGVSCRMGRESKQEFNERYAGVIYTEDVKPGEGTYNLGKEETSIASTLNLFRYEHTSTIVFMPESTGEADPAIQAFNLRAIITNNPGNRVLPVKPANYDAAYFAKEYTHKADKVALSRPNSKSSMNYPKIVGLQNKYVEGNWEQRSKIIQQFKDELLGLLYFRQNDPSLDPAIREHWRKYGLAKDEFVDNDHLPYELYVRESRRIKGRKVFTQNDAQLLKGLSRAPVHPDSIGVTEWFLDSHACTGKRVTGSKAEGEVMLKSETVPGQIPLATLFPQEFDNMMVPVCLSATHIGWGAIRLEPVWMNVGEVAAYAAVETLARKISIHQIDTERFIYQLASKRFMLTFFNDMEGRESANWYPAVQYLGTKGFFGTYEALPQKKLTRKLAERWAEHLQAWNRKTDWDANNQAMMSLKAEEAGGDLVTAGEFASLVERSLRLTGQVKSLQQKLALKNNVHVTRGDAARLIFEAISIPLSKRTM